MNDFDLDLQETVMQGFCSATGLKRDQISLETDVLESGSDSLSMMIIAGLVESKYGVDFSENVILDLYLSFKIKDIVSKLSNAINERDNSNELKKAE